MPIENNQVLKTMAEGIRNGKSNQMMVAAFDYPNTMEKVLPIEEICRKNNRKRLQSRNRQNRHDAYAN